MYDIILVIEIFLFDIYGFIGREDCWMFLEGFISGGLVIYDDKFVYFYYGMDFVGD